MEKYLRMSPAAVVIGALRVKAPKRGKANWICCNSLEPEEGTLHEPPHLDLPYVLIFSPMNRKKSTL